jgi:hypothetical protein
MKTYNSSSTFQLKHLSIISLNLQPQERPLKPTVESYIHRFLVIINLSSYENQVYLLRKKLNQDFQPSICSILDFQPSIERWHINSSSLYCNFILYWR